jgi:hypothetical protein
LNGSEIGMMFMLMEIKNRLDKIDLPLKEIGKICQELMLRQL